jgi:hypothetical protein
MLCKPGLTPGPLSLTKAVKERGRRTMKEPPAGFEPAQTAWQTVALPDYAIEAFDDKGCPEGFEPSTSGSTNRRSNR